MILCQVREHDWQSKVLTNLLLHAAPCKLYNVLICLHESGLGAHRKTTHVGSPKSSGNSLPDETNKKLSQTQVSRLTRSSTPSAVIEAVHKQKSLQAEIVQIMSTNRRGMKSLHPWRSLDLACALLYPALDPTIALEALRMADPTAS